MSMDIFIQLASGVLALSAGAWYWMKRGQHRREYKFNMYLEKQSFVVDETESVRMSHPVLHEETSLAALNCIYNIFQHGIRLSSTAPCLGRRSSTTESYRWKNYAEVSEDIMRCANAINSMDGIVNKRVGIFSKNCPEWIIAELACCAYGYTVVPLYETFGDNACRHILEETGLNIVVCGTDKQAETILRMKLPELCTVVVISPTSDDLQQLATDTVSVFSFESFLNLAVEPWQPLPIVDPESLFMICYTSGSTGSPKGVMIKHRQFNAVIKHVQLRLEDEDIASGTVHICYLPLPHILEQLASMITLFFGGRIGFLTTDITGFIQDAKELQPTYLFAVPRVLCRVYGATMQKLSSYPLLGKLLHYAVNKRIEQQEMGYYYQNSIWDLLFFGKVRESVGGRVKVLISGSAPIADEVLRFTRAAFACPVLNAYGLTESCGVVSLTYFGDCRTTHTGSLAPGVSVKLGDVPDMGLCVSKGGVGELCIKGPNCTEGYFMNDSETSKLIDADGWLHTGDLGTFNNVGGLELVGRSKATFKLSQGEYVSPEKCEEIYQLCDLVSQIYVEGNPLYAYPVAVVVPNMSELCKRIGISQQNISVKSNGQTYSSESMCHSYLCTDSYAKKFLLEEMNTVGRKHNLKGFELVKAIYLITEPFTIDNQLLTVSMKPSRVNLRRRFSDVIDELYGNAIA